MYMNKSLNDLFSLDERYVQQQSTVYSSSIFIYQQFNDVLVLMIIMNL